MAEVFGAMGEHKGHRERVRQRLEQGGIESFAPHEILELLLYYAIPRGDTNPVAHRLLERFGSLSAVLEAPKDALMGVDGIGASAATLLTLVPQISKRYLQDKSDVGLVLDSSEKIGRYVRPFFIGENRERAYLICLDRKRKLLNCLLLSEGDLNRVSVSIRDILDAVLRCNASYVVLAHNHSQGFALPSHEDIQMTAQVRQALKLVSVDLIDHIVVARDDFISMADSGLI